MSKRKRKNERRKKKNQDQRKTGWYRGLHHIIPSSRGGSSSWTNLYPRERWGEDYSDKHDAIHLLFVNRTPKELIEIIEEHCAEDGKIQESFFATSFWAVFDSYADKEEKHKRKDRARLFNFFKIRKRKHAWKTVFGKMNGFEAIEWIEREFIRKEWAEGPSNT